MANGKRINDWNNLSGNLKDYTFAVDKNGLIESEKASFEEVQNSIIGKYAQRRIFADIKVGAGSSSYDLRLRVGKQFIDYSQFNKGNYNSANHYNNILWDIFDGNNKVYDAGKFASITELRNWLDNNITLGGSGIANNVRLIAYFNETLTDQKLTNLQGYNKAYMLLKTNGFIVDYNNNNILHLGQTDNWHNQLILDIWADLLWYDTAPTTTDGSEVWLQSVRKNLYNALPVTNQYLKAPYIFHDSESEGRKVWVPSLNDFVLLNDIIQNYKDPLWVELVQQNTRRQNAVVIESQASYIRYNKYESIWLRTIDFLQGSMVRFYMLKGNYYDGTSIRDFYAMTVKPLGQDLFYTRYYDNSIYSLFAILKNNTGKDKLRKLNVTYIGNEFEDKGWEIDKDGIKEILSNHQNLYNDRNGSFFPDINLVVMNELTGEISPLPEFKISVKTRMRGSGFNLMIENK